MLPPPNPCPQPSPTASEDSKRQKRRTHCQNRASFPPPCRFSMLLPRTLPSCSSSFSLIRWLPLHAGSYSTLPSHPCISEHRLPRKGCSLQIAFQPMSLKIDLALASLVLVPANPKRRIWVLHITKSIPTFLMWTVYGGVLTFNEVIKMELFFFKSCQSFFVK